MIFWIWCIVHHMHAWLVALMYFDLGDCLDYYLPAVPFYGTIDFGASEVVELVGSAPWRR